MASTRACLPCVLLLVTCWAASSRAQDAAAPAPESASESNPDLAAEEAAMEAESAATAVRRQQVDAQRKAALTLALEAVDHEQRHTSRLLPLLATGIGIALLVTGIAVGAGKALACDDSCQMSFWPTWLVVGGGTVTTAGGIWLALKDRDIAELQSRRYQIERELDYLEWSAALAPPRPASGTPPAALALRF